MHSLRTLITALLLPATMAVVAQQPFAAEIQEFKKHDSIQFPAANSILFVGSSSFRMWNNLQQDFPGYPVINRGFGGATLPDVIRYAGDIIIPYKPKQTIIYCGENDLAVSDTVTAKMVLQRFVELFQLIRKKLPGMQVSFVSLKPSPSRARLFQKMQVANNLIKEYLQKQRNTSFIDVYHKMLGEDGLPAKDLFLEDDLHMNAKGYAIWKKAIAPYLVNQ